jgi:L,D-peptidoglycan transpeptidase YkuD (ErfK/YbiS/YcfS/YnhG family)
MRATSVTSQAPLVSQTSTGTADVKTFAALPKNAGGVIVSVETTAARVTFDGTTPDATHGVAVPVGVFQFNFGEGTVIKFASTAGAASIVSVIPTA